MPLRRLAAGALLCALRGVEGRLGSLGMQFWQQRHEGAPRQPRRAIIQKTTAKSVLRDRQRLSQAAEAQGIRVEQIEMIKLRVDVIRL